jgi:putative transposase
LAESCIQEEAVTVSRACRVVGLHKSLWYYRSRKDDTEIIEKLRELAERFPTRGFDDYYGKIRNEGLRWNRKRVLRVYRSLKLGLRRKHKRRLPARIKQPLQQAQKPNESYSMDFLSDALSTKRKVRVLNIMDDCTRESLSVYADFSIPGEKVVDVLKSIVLERGKPEQIRVDNGPEFLSKVFVEWCNKQSIAIKYIQPGKPMQNGYIERLNRTFREDVLDAYEFDNLEQLRILCDEWQHQYNNFHPHQALNGKTPAMTVNNYQKQNQRSLN